MAHIKNGVTFLLKEVLSSGVVPSVDGLDVCYNFFDGAFIPVLTRRESKSRFLFFFCSFRFNKFKVRFHLATIDL